MARVTTLIYRATGRKKPRSSATETPTPTPTPSTTQYAYSGLLSNGQSFYAPTVSADNFLSLPFLDNDQSFYSPIVSRETVFVSPPKLANTQVFFGPTVNQKIQLPLVANTQTFNGALILAGQSLRTSLLTNGQTFYGPTINQRLDTGLLSNAEEFYAPTVLTGVNVLPALFTNTQAFYGPQLNLKLSAPLLSNSQSFPSAAVGGLLVKPPSFASGQAFYPAQVNMRVVAGFVNNTQVIYGPAMSADQLVVVPKLTNTQTFYGEQVNLKLTAPLLSNAQTFFPPAVILNTGQVIGSAYLLNSQTFFGPRINRNMRAGLLTNANGFLPFTVGNAAGPGYVLSTPGFVLTSDPADAPQFDVTLNADHYAGYYLRIQRSTDGLKSNDGSYVNQTLNAFNNGVLHMITPSELAALAITSTNLGADGYTNPAGAWIQQYRIEREDGALSAWVEFSGTVTSPVATWYAQNGVNKSSELTIAFPFLTWRSINQGAPQGVRSTVAKTGKGHWEQSIVAIGGANTSWRMGVVDAATALGPQLYPAPGLSSPGCVLAVNGSGAVIHRNGGAQTVTLPGGGGGAVGDVAACEFDTATATVRFYYKRSGGSFTLLASVSLSSLVPAVWHGYGAGCGSGDSGTANYGSSAFAMTPTSGHTGW